MKIFHRLYLLYQDYVCTSKRPFLTVQYIYLAGTFLFHRAGEGVNSKCLLSCFLKINDSKYSFTLTIQSPVQAHFINSCTLHLLLLELPVPPIFGENRLLFPDLVAGICWALSCGHSGARRSGNTLDCIKNLKFFALTLLSCHAWQIAAGLWYPRFLFGPGLR